MTRWVAVLAAVALVQAPAAAGWSWPVDGPVLRPFVFGDDPYASGQHRGIDIGAPPEMPVHAASAGTVSFAGTVPSGGRAVTVQTGGGFSVTYLELGALRVARGAEVAEGDPIGTVGPAAHVHFGVRVTADPHGYRDPLLFLPARVEAPGQADRVEVAPPAAAQPDPVVQPSAAQGAATEPDGPPPTDTEPPEAPPAATEPAAARPDPVASDSAAVVVAEPRGKAEAKAGARERPIPVAEPVAARDTPASEATARPTVAARPVVTRTSTRPAPRPARAKAKRSAGKPSAETSPVAARSKEVAEPVSRVSGRPRLGAATAVRQATLHKAPAQPRAHGQPERPREEPRPARLGLALGLLTAAMLGVIVAAAAALRRRNQAAPREAASPLREDASLEAAKPVASASCPMGRLRTPHVIHGCARAREAGWVVPLGTLRRRPAPPWAAAATPPEKGPRGHPKLSAPALAAPAKPGAARAGA